MTHQRRGRKRLACNKLNQFGRSVTFAVAENLFVQPGLERREVAARKHRGEAAQIAVGGFEKLGGTEIAERIGWKIADEGRRPMNVLQTAVGVGRWLDAQILLIFLAP